MLNVFAVASARSAKIEEFIRLVTASIPASTNYTSIPSNSMPTPRCIQNAAVIATTATVGS